MRKTFLVRMGLHRTPGCRVVGFVVAGVFVIDIAIVEYLSLVFFRVVQLGLFLLFNSHDT